VGPYEPVLGGSFNFEIIVSSCSLENNSKSKSQSWLLQKSQRTINFHEKTSKELPLIGSLTF
jgi:hypothetical protein